MFWLAWSQIDGIGPTLLKRLHQHFGKLETAWAASTAELGAVEGFGPQTTEIVDKGRSRLDPVQVLRDHEAANPQFWTPADSDYPRLLFEITDPPPVLYYRGIVDPAESRGDRGSIAIVGTRYPSDYGKRWTRKLSKALAQAGFSVVSGLAQGIDTEAHRSCLEARGRTVAVLGTGVNIVYPAQNRQLAEQVFHQGLMLSEYPAGTKPDRGNFPRRNRIIAGLCRATLVLEAPTKSGALITARLANDYGRDVYALPASLDNERGRGCLELLNVGAQMILGEQELLEALGDMPQFPATTEPAQLPLLVDLPPELAAILQVVSSQPVALDWIIQQTGLPTENVSSGLMHLEILDLVTNLPGMRYQRR